MGHYWKWMIGFMIGGVTSMVFNMVTKHMNTGQMTAHDMRRRDISQQDDEKLNEILTLLIQNNLLEAAENYNRMLEEERKSILPELIKKSYRVEKVRNLLDFAHFIKPSLSSEKLKAVQLILAEFNSEVEPDPAAVLLIDCFVSISFEGSLSPSEFSIVQDIIKGLKGDVNRALNTLADQINQANLANDSFLNNFLHRPTFCRRLEYYLCHKHITEAVQIAYKPNDNNIKNLILFVERLNYVCMGSNSYELQGKLLLQIFRQMEISGHMTETSKREMIEAVRKLLTVPKTWKMTEDEKINFSGMGVKMGHSFDDDILNTTVELAKQGQGGIAAVVYNRISSPDYPKLVDRVYNLNFIWSLITLSDYLPIKEALLDHMIAHGDGHNPVIFYIYAKKGSVAFRKISNLAIEMALPMRSNDFKFVPLLEKASEFYIAEIVESLYEPREDTQVQLLTFAEKLMEEGNIDGSATAYIHLNNEERHEHLFKLHLVLKMAQGMMRLRLRSLNGDIKEKIDELWAKKIPWDINYIVRRKLFCIVNNNYESDHLLASFNQEPFVRSVRIGNPIGYSGKGLRWILPSNGTHYKLEADAIHSLEGFDDMLMCTSGKRKVSLRISNMYSWELHNYDWKNNLYMLYNVEYQEYLYSDDQLRLSPPTGRQVYLGKKQDPVHPASIWRFSKCDLP